MYRSQPQYYVESLIMYPGRIFRFPMAELRSLLSGAKGDVSIIDGTLVGYFRVLPKNDQDEHYGQRRLTYLGSSFVNAAKNGKRFRFALQ